MDPKTEMMSPAQRMSKNLCPECGDSLADLGVEAHRDYHYPNVRKIPLEGEALVRYTMLTSYAKAQKAAASQEQV